MKKVAILTALLTFAAGSAFAATAVTNQPVFATGAGVSITSNDTTPKPIGKLSASVAMGWNGGTAGYAMNTQHQKGTKAFGTSHDSTAIYSTDVTTGTAVGTLSNSNSTSFGSWTAM